MGNFSRDTFNRLKHYVGVRLQQGVPLVDADWNELEDIRKYELQAFLKWYVGDGVPTGNNGFRITFIVAINDSFNDNFVIGGGDGTPEGVGRCLVDGWDVVNESDIDYNAQALFNNNDLATAWEVDVLPALTVPAVRQVRQDLVYLDVWEREVDSTEDSELINPAIGLETAVRLKREWVVRVNENSDALPTASTGHNFYPLASLQWNGAAVSVVDLRNTRLNLAEIAQRVETLEAHPSRTDNPHEVTANQIGALAVADYDFNNSREATVVFTQNDDNDATRTLDIGFRPRFVWVIGLATTNPISGGPTVSTNISAYADLQDSIRQLTNTRAIPFQRRTIQRCTGTDITVTPTGNLYQSSIGQAICKVRFTLSDSAPIFTNELNVIISNVSNTSLTTRFSRASLDGGTSSGSGSHSNGDIQQLVSFRIELRLLCLG
ncbi:MAG: hypothetical protein CSB13_01850 [Chloroflexi bacterium]|nr:MAG: hypothetical protein CSB13_01850 [Chloroflexota bacterium]